MFTLLTLTCDFTIDRRTTSVVGAVLCYFTSSYVFSGPDIDLLHAVNFDVVVLLSSIMIINHLVIHLKETKDIINYLQRVVQSDPIKGLWLISIAAFVVSPFLTNDGVCLLFVEPILKSFQHAPLDLADIDEPNAEGNIQLRKTDAIYFLLALACSANIGSALTYTGNPQNMIVSSDAIGVLPSYKFLMYMLPSSLFSWVISKLAFLVHLLIIPSFVLLHTYAAIKWIQRCWLRDRLKSEYTAPATDEERSTRSPLYSEPLSSLEVEMTAAHREEEQQHVEPFPQQEQQRQRSRRADSSSSDTSMLLTPGPAKTIIDMFQSVYARYFQFLMESIARNADSTKVELVMSPRRRMALEKSRTLKPAVFFVVSPAPYVVLFLLGAMVVMIFADVMPISGLICLFSILMIVVVVMGNHWRGQQIWVEEACSSSTEGNSSSGGGTGDSFASMTDHEQFKGSGISQKNNDLCSDASQSHEDHQLGSLTREDELDNLNRFFEALYASIDYNLLLIFLGLFIVIENLSTTGIPRYIWHRIVGKAPFHSFASILGISAFVLFSSQFLGNVPVIQLAKPNVEVLDDKSKRLAWAVLSFVATVGGNLTITGSAGNH